MLTPRLVPQNGSPSGEQLFDVCAYVIYRGKHDRIALNIDPKSSFGSHLYRYRTPSHGQSSVMGSLDGANIVLSYGDPNLYLELRKTPSVLSASHCMQIFGLQLPKTQKFNTRLIYCVRLREDTGRLVKCCQNIQIMKWYPKSQVLDNKVENIWGSEVIEFSKLCTSSRTESRVN